MTQPKPTIYQALIVKLGRIPSHRELCDEVRRILFDSHCERVEKGKLRHQRR